MLKIILCVVLISIVPADSTLLKKFLLKKAIAAKLGAPFLLRSLLTGESILPSFGILGGANADKEVVVKEVVPEVDVAVPIDTDIDDSEVVELEEPISDELYNELSGKEEEVEEKPQEVSHYFVPIRSYTFTYPYPYSYAYRRAEPSYAYGAP